MEWLGMLITALQQGLRPIEWPNVFLPLIPTGLALTYKLFPQVTGLSPRETLLHRGFQVICAVIIMANSGAWIGGHLWEQGVVFPPVLPSDHLVVNIAQFDPITDDAKGVARNLHHDIKKELANLSPSYETGLIVEVKETNNSLVGPNDEEMLREAQRIGASRGGRSHLVIAGDVKTDPLGITVRFFPVGLDSQTEIEQPRLTDTPTETRTTTSAAAMTAVAVARIIYGRALCYSGRWNEGIWVLEPVPSDEASIRWGKQLSLGHCYFARGQHSKDPEADYRWAYNAFKDVQAATDSRQVYPAKRSMAEVLTALGQVSSAENAVERLQEAERLYHELLPTANRACNGPSLFAVSSQSCPWAELKGSLGVTLTALGERLPAGESTEALRSGVQAFDEVIEFYEKHKKPVDRARSLYRRGNAKQRLGERTRAEEQRWFEEAEKDYTAALILFGQHPEHKSDRAAALNARGSSRRARAEVAPDERVLELLRQAMSDYKASLSARTRPEAPQQWAATQFNLGVTYQRMGERSAGDDARQRFEASLAAYDDALSVYGEETFPQPWARVVDSKAAMLASWSRLQDCVSGESDLNESIRLYATVLKVRDREHLPQEWGFTQVGLGSTWLALAEHRLRCRQRRASALEAIAESLVHYCLALEVLAGSSHESAVRREKQRAADLGTGLGRSAGSER